MSYLSYQPSLPAAILFTLTQAKSAADSLAIDQTDAVTFVSTTPGGGDAFTLGMDESPLTDRKSVV